MLNTKRIVTGKYRAKADRLLTGYDSGCPFVSCPDFLRSTRLPACRHLLSASPIASGLNLAQQEAVNFLHGPCLVLAGAGSGKTRVITHKIGRLIQSGLKPEQIAAITFTNKAAAEMRERAKALIGKPAKGVLVCTFHALGVRMLRQDGAALGLKPQFSILDSDDVTSIIKDAGGSTDAATAKQWQWTISLWKNMGLNAAEAHGAGQRRRRARHRPRDGAL
jgi:superfamily I DNA/RNA helicase